MVSTRRRGVSTSNQGAASSSEETYKLVRKAGPFEVLSHLFHDLGIQSNILLSAHYTHPSSSHLTPDRIYTALKAVIKDHPALSTIGVSQPSEKKEGNHRLWEAHLPTINLKDCVVFVDELPHGDVAFGRIFEKAHNEWFDTQDKTKPWWKVAVFGGEMVVFIYHHSIGDGLSGYTFHRSLLAALNAVGTGAEAFEESTDAIVNVPDKTPTPYPLDQIEEKLSWIYVIYGFLFWQIFRFFVSEKYFLFSDARFSRTYPTVTRPLPQSERTITKAKVLRIEKQTMLKCLAACRKHNTSFTALMHTLIQVTLAADIYPKAKFGFSRQAVNIRPLLKFDTGPHAFNNAASQYTRVQWLSKYRAAGSSPSRITTDFQNATVLYVDIPLIWTLAKQYKKAMNDSIYTSREVLQDFLMGNLLGEDDEEAGGLCGIGLYQNNSFLISNIGVFEQRGDVADDRWGIQDVGFSAGAIRASMGDIGMSFNVSSVKDRDCVICATWEEGVLKEEMVQKCLEGVKGRLRSVI